MALEPEVRSRLQSIANVVKQMIPIGNHFVLMVFTPVSEDRKQTLEYISDCERPDIVPVLEEWIAKTGVPGSFGKHLN